MGYLIFIFYLIICCSVFYFLKIEKQSGLSIGFIISLFVLKVIAGCINLYLHYNEFLSNDIHFYYTQSMIDLQEYHSNPSHFFYNWFFNWGDFSAGYSLFSKESMSYWSDIGVLIHSKFMNLANILSFGEVYTDVIFFNVIYFMGLLQLYKVFYQWQVQKKCLFVFSIFLVPSTLFWCSGIHKDGWIIAAIGFTLYATKKYLDTQRLKYILTICLSLFLLFVSRYFVFLCFFPAFILWILLRKAKYQVTWFASTYFVLLMIFFFVHKLFPSFHPMEIIIAKQEAFFTLKGYSDMATPKLDNSLSSFVANFPSALNHIFLQPYFTIASPIKYKIAAFDAWLILACIISCLLYLKRGQAQTLFYISMMVFALSMYLFLGYTIPNCGALVRYKSEFTAVLLPVLFSLSEIPWLKRFYSSTEM